MKRDKTTKAEEQDAARARASTKEVVANALEVAASATATPAEKKVAQQTVDTDHAADAAAIQKFPDSPIVANAVGNKAFQLNDLDRANSASALAAQNARNRLANAEDADDAKENKEELLKALQTHASVAEKHRDWPTAKSDTDEIIGLQPEDAKILDAAKAINAMARSHIGRVDPGLKKDTFNQPWTSGVAGVGNTKGAPTGIPGANTAPITNPNPQETAQLKRLLEDAQGKLGLKDPEGALKSAEDAGKLDDKNAQAKLLAAIALMSLNRLQQALDMASKAISLREAQGANTPPERSWLAAAYTTRGRTEEALGDANGARGDYKHAVELDPAGQAQAATVFLQRLDSQLGGGSADVPAAQMAARRAAEKRRGWLLVALATLLFGGAAAVALRRKFLGSWGADTTGGNTPSAKQPTMLDDTPVSTTGGLGAGLSLGHYELRRPLGRGGMGEVWEAFDHSLNRLVAIKKLVSGRAAEPGALDELIEEALNVAKLKHPNIVSIHFVFRGQQTGDVYLVFEHVGEGTVSNALEEGPLAPDRAAGIVRGVAAALDYAHAQGVIHRDLKPSNILLERGAAKVGDFGIAKLTEHQDGTMTARNAGTPAYMAPEQSMGVVSRQTDLYALGVTAFQMLTAQLPFPPSQPELKGTGLFVAATQRVPALPKGVDAFFSRALNPDPKLRFANGKEFADAFERAVEAVTPLPRSA